MVKQWRELEKRTADVIELSSLAEGDTSLHAEIQSETEAIASQIDRIELELAFSSEYDARNAILTIHAGAGGTESQ